MWGYSSSSCSCLKKLQKRAPTAKMVLEETVSNSCRCPSLPCFISFSPLHSRDFKSPTWPTGQTKFAATAASYRDFPGDQVISTLSFMSSTPQTSCKILKMENGTSDHSSVCVNLCFQRNSPQMDHVLWATYFQLMGEFCYLKTFSSTSGGGRTRQDGTRRQSITATRHRWFRVSNREASCV